MNEEAPLRKRYRELATASSAQERVVRMAKIADRPSSMQHRDGFPAALTRGVDVTEALPRAAIALSVETPNGFHLYRFSKDGEFAGETWHPDEASLLRDASVEYGDAIGDWIEMPAEYAKPATADPVTYALSTLIRKG